MAGARNRATMRTTDKNCTDTQQNPRVFMPASSQCVKNMVECCLSSSDRSDMRAGGVLAIACGVYMMRAVGISASTDTSRLCPIDS